VESNSKPIIDKLANRETISTFERSELSLFLTLFFVRGPAGLGGTHFFRVTAATEGVWSSSLSSAGHLVLPYGGAAWQQVRICGGSAGGESAGSVAAYHSTPRNRLSVFAPGGQLGCIKSKANLEIRA
jgi:hypothetical protein